MSVSESAGGTAPSATGAAPAAPRITHAPLAGSSATEPSAPAAEPAAHAAPPMAAVATHVVGARPVGPRRARLALRRVDPWSVMKFSLVFSFCLLIVFVVAVSALYLALDGLNVFDSVNRVLLDATSAAGPGGTRVGGLELDLSATQVVGGATLLGLVNVVLMTAVSTLGAFLYNLCSDLVGGVEVTLTERV